MKLPKLLIGTHNQAKVLHYKQFLSGIPYQILTLSDLNITDEPEETGETLEENAALKAKYYFENSGLPTLADDSGFEIPALGNFPGVASRRFKDSEHKMSDMEVITGIFEAAKGLKAHERRARMRMVVALALDDSNIKLADGEIEGIVPEAPYEKIMPHFPYRSVLFLPGPNKWFYELTEADEDNLGYRRTAVEKIKKYL